MNNIVVFTLKGCGHCVELKKELIVREIPYNEIEISENEEIWNQVVKQTGHNALPTVFIGLEGNENGPVQWQFFSFFRISSCTTSGKCHQVIFIEKQLRSRKGDLQHGSIPGNPT